MTALERRAVLDALLMPVRPPAVLFIGGRGFLAVFTWGLIALFVFPGTSGVLAAAAVIAVNTMIHPTSLRRLARPRQVLLLAMLFLTTYWFAVDGGALERLPLAAQMLLRAVALLALVDGVTSSVQITEIAGVFERAGLHGLGFSLGVALNLLPSIRESSRQVWFSLRLRGGLRRRRMHALRLVFVTIVAGALRRAEDTALAAEARAFDSQKARPFPLSSGRLDSLAWVGGALVLIGARILVG